jgi:hypothetical protein
VTVRSKEIGLSSVMAPPRLKNEVICQRSGHSLHPNKPNRAICDVGQEEKDIRITKADGTFGDPKPQLKIHHDKHEAVSIARAPTSIARAPTSIARYKVFIKVF